MFIESMLVGNMWLGVSMGWVMMDEVGTFKQLFSIYVLMWAIEEGYNGVPIFLTYLFLSFEVTYPPIFLC